MGLLAVLLSSVAVAITGQPDLTVVCHAPPDRPVWGNVVGWTYYDGPTTIYLRYCEGTVALRRPDVDTFAHELLHAEHPAWGERRVYATEHAYGAVVLRALRSYGFPLRFLHRLSAVVRMV